LLGNNYGNFEAHIQEPLAYARDAVTAPVREASVGIVFQKAVSSYFTSGGGK
jgi:hypothetical protein